MNKKRTNAVTDAELERPFDFSGAHPNPYVGWSRRARASVAADEERARGKPADLSPKVATDPAARKSSTAPDAKSTSASVWRFLENDAPGFNEAMEEGTSQIAGGKATRLSATRAKKDRGRG